MKLKEVDILYTMDSRGSIDTVKVLGIIKVDKKFKEEKNGFERYVTDHYLGGQAVRAIGKEEIGRFFFYTPQEAREARLKEFEAMVKEYQGRVDKLNKIKL